MKTTTDNTSNPQGASSKKRTYVMLGLGILATTILTFFGIRYWKKNKQTQPANADSPDFKAENPYTAPKVKPKSKPKAKAPTAQNATATKQAAPADKPKAEEPSLFEPEDLAAKIRSGIITNNFLKAYTNLKLIRNTADYSNVNKEFLKFKTGFTTQTIVNGLLSKFKLASQRQVLFSAFKRIGLKYSGNKWTLGDTETATPLLITTQPTKVWKDPKTSVAVPVNMVLGREVCKRGAFTLFENQHRYYLVESTSIKKH